MKGFKRLSLPFLLILVLGSVLAGCGSKTGDVKVKIGEVTRSVFYAPEYVALSQGFSRMKGWMWSLQTIPGGDKTMTALLSGAIDVALVGSETSIYVYQQGADDPVINFAQAHAAGWNLLVCAYTGQPFYMGQSEGVDLPWAKARGHAADGGRIHTAEQGD